jgi:hypothetical protein
MHPSDITMHHLFFPRSVLGQWSSGPATRVRKHQRTIVASKLVHIQIIEYIGLKVPHRSPRNVIKKHFQGTNIAHDTGMFTFQFGRFHETTRVICLSEFQMFSQNRTTKKRAFFCSWPIGKWRSAMHAGKAT